MSEPDPYVAGWERLSAESAGPFEAGRTYRPASLPESLLEPLELELPTFGVSEVTGLATTLTRRAGAR